MGKIIRKTDLDLSRRSMLKTMLYTPPILMFSGGCSNLFVEGKSGPLFEPRIIPKGQKIRAVQIGVFNRGGQVLKIFNQHSDSQIEFVAFADVLFTSHDSTMKG